MKIWNKIALIAFRPRYMQEFWTQHGSKLHLITHNNYFMEMHLSEKQIDIAQQLFIAIAFRNVVAADFKRMEQEIIDDRAFFIDEIYYSKEFEQLRESLPHDRIIQHPAQTKFIAGCRHFGTDSFKNTDAQVYYSLLRSKALKAGYIFGENASCEIDNQVANLELQLIETTQNIHGVQPQQIIQLEDKQELINPGIT